MSVLSTTAAALDAGEWAVLSTNNFNAGLYHPTGSTDNSIRITEYSTNFFWDRGAPPNIDSGNGFIWFFGNPHPGYGLPGRLIRYRESDNTWELVWQSPTTGGAHVYDAETWSQDDRRLWRMMGPSGRQPQYWSGSAWVNYGGLMPSGQWTYTAWDYFPERGEMWAYAGDVQQIHRFVKSTGQWFTVGSVSSGGSALHPMATYCPIKKYVCLGAKQGDGTVFWRVNESGQILTAATAPFDLSMAHGANCTSCPVTGVMLAISDNGIFRAYDPATNTWSGNLQNPYGFQGSQDRHGMACTISTYGVTLWANVTATTGTIYLYKHAQAGPPPVAPTALRVVP